MLIFRILLKENDLHYKSKREKNYNFGKYSLPFVFLRDIHEGYLSLEDPDNKQSNFATKIKNLDKGIKKFEKSFF